MNKRKERKGGGGMTGDIEREEEQGEGRKISPCILVI